MTDRDEAFQRRRLARIAMTAGTAAAVLIWGSVAANDSTGPSGETPEKESKAEVACDAEVPAAAEPQQFPSPDPVLQEGVDYAAVIHTSCGDITMDLLEEDAPITVNNFAFLAQQGFYDGLQWFRVELNSVIEAGDPNNVLFDPPDGPGYTIDEELPDQPKEYVFGAVAMANEGTPGSTGSNFFIVIHENRPAGYQPAYSIFGRVAEESYEVLTEIGRQPTRGGNEPIEAVRPVTPIYIESIEIVES